MHTCADSCALLLCYIAQNEVFKSALKTSRTNTQIKSTYWGKSIF